MRLTTAAVAELVGGTLHGPDVAIDGASIDSRTVLPGQLFVPVVAERDGHDFIDSALARGAGAYLSSRPPIGGSAVVVADTAEALSNLAGAVRDRLPDRVIAVTGSVGKTTVKDLLASALATTWRTHATPASYNNELGVPLTVLATPDDAEALVLEMGARFPGDLARLTALVPPTIGVITSIGMAHSAHLGGPAGVREEKGSLIVGLPTDGYAILNDVDCGPDVRMRTVARVLTFGIGRGDVAATIEAVDADLRSSILVSSPWGEARATLQVRGEHQAANAAAAVATAAIAGVPLEAAVAGVATATGSERRAQHHRTATGLLVIDDSYNANPTSLSAALHALGTVQARRRVAVLGPMAELGSASDDAHAAAGDLASTLGIEVIAVDTSAYGGRMVNGHDEALEALSDLGVDDAVLVKASRSAALDLLVDRLLEGPAT